MPVQHTIFGQNVRLQMPPRRFQAILFVAVFVVASIFFYGPPDRESLPTYEQVAEAVKHPTVPDLGELPIVPNPFGTSAHKPPVQPNSTTNGVNRAIEWVSDFKWRNPFSDRIFMDENRAVLPPTRERPPIYTYFEVPSKQDKAITEAENRLVLAWRRAWWAQGFKPIVLSLVDAQKHPLYRLVHGKKLDPKVELEIMRWLAWGHMKGGILTNWLAVPMADYDNAMLSFLRRAQYPKLSRIQTLSNGVFFGEGAAIETALKKLVNHDLLKNVTESKDKLAQLARKEGGTVVNLLAASDIAVDKKADGIARYDSETIAKKYATVQEKLTNTTQAEGLGLLASLINSHLHLTFQEQHAEGLVVVKPLPEHTTALMYEAIDVARNLTQCPTTPMPKSCPPNRPKCKPCDPNKPKIHQYQEFVNTTKFFTIGTVPHPFTLTSLHYTRDVLDANFLRNNAKRDQWINELTRKSIGKDKTESYRLLQWKDLVAAAPAHTLWLTAERIIQKDIDWIMGFELPNAASPTAEPTSPSEKSELIMFPRPEMPKLEGRETPDAVWIRKEEDRLDIARRALQSKDRRMVDMVAAVEQWNLADTEAWKFARAYSARRRMERKVWEEQEKSFTGSEKKAGIRRED